MNASSQVLDAVARTLRLDRAEREHLYRLAEATPLRAECARPVIPDAIREIVHSLEPLPASLINSRFDFLMSNSASEELFWEWHTMPCVHKNTLWCCVTEPTAHASSPSTTRRSATWWPGCAPRTGGTSVTRTGKKTSAAWPA